MSIIWTPSSARAATSAYVLEPIVAMAMPSAPSSSSNPPAPSVTEEVGAGRAGSVMSIIWTPSSNPLATSAYVLEPIVAMAMPSAPSSSSNPPAPSVTEEVGAGRAGSVMSIIWTPSSSYAVTSAYVLEPIVAMAMPSAPSSSSNPPAPSVTEEVGAGRAGSVMSIIWTPSSSYAL